MIQQVLAGSGVVLVSGWLSRVSKLWLLAYVVHDTGPKIKGREIDIFIDKRSEARQFGRKPVRVRVIDLPEPKR